MNVLRSLVYEPESPECFVWHLRHKVSLPPGVEVVQDSVLVGGEFVPTDSVLVTGGTFNDLMVAEERISTYLRSKGSENGSESELGWT